ncbi:MAG: tRNA (adenosine(37)-N6)-threonylcarbamoyltransferase complex dimerization subunit type 1 TsaB [Aureliella sp.]
MTVWNLAIECSGIGGSVSLSCNEDRELSETLPGGGGSVQFLAPTIEKLVSDAGILKPDFLSVTVGPGSFTGLRVGISTAKMLGYAWQIPIVPVDTLHAIACEAVGTESGVSLVVPVINAFRKQVFSGVWRYRDLTLHADTGSQVVDAKLWTQDPLASLGWTENYTDRISGDKVVVAGPGLEVFQPDGSLGFSLKPGGPIASSVAQIGWDGFHAKQTVEADELQPNYVRPSAAEEARNSTANR